ncbi:MAG: hypothetical protein KAU01_10890, partial [Candidatus Cloacimonetes bacterium]|nr:hypothetical protein [Candidatus Cloacimonadota bacterium]
MNYFEQLEYNKIKSILADECHSDLGRELVDSLCPLKDRKEIVYRLDLTFELQSLLKNGITFNFENVSNVSKLLQELKHQTYNFEEFRKLYYNISTANKISDNVKDLEDYPEYLELIKKIVPLEKLERRYLEIFDSEGNVKDTASSELKSIRRRKKQLRQNVIGVLNQKIEKLSLSNYLHDKIVTQRDGRFVIPIKEGASSFIKG